MSNFEDFQLANPLLRAVESKGYKTATPIQADAIPHVVNGGDLVGCAQTGTGKTAAFALPTLHRLLTAGKRNTPSKKKKRIRALVLAPTRELTAQVAENFAAYGRYTKLRHCVIFGGVSQVPQVRKLRAGVDTVIATPGRLIDLVDQGHVDLSHVEILIFDEADQMLDMGFVPDLRKIESHVPSNRQTLMFSATMPPEIRKLASQWLDKPINVRTAPISAPAERVEQSVYFVDRRNKIRLLEILLEQTGDGRKLLFSRTKHGADKIVKHLSKCKIRATAIHGNKSQAARKRALDQFKSQNPPILVATDVAARGLDIKNVEHVINFDLPETPETYVHRIGRTGRAGAEGKAVSFCTSDEVYQLRSIEKLTRRKIDIAIDHLDITTDVAPPPTTAPGKSFRRGQQKGGWKKGGPRKFTGGRKKSGFSGKASKSKSGKPAGNKATGSKPAGGASGAKRRKKRRPAAAGSKG